MMALVVPEHVKSMDNVITLVGMDARQVQPMLGLLLIQAHTINGGVMGNTEGRIQTHVRKLYPDLQQLSLMEAVTILVGMDVVQVQPTTMLWLIQAHFINGDVME